MSWTASSTSTLSELCRRLDGKPYDPDDDLMTRCLSMALCYIDRTVDPPVVRYIDGSDCEIVGWVDFDGKSVRSSGVDVTVDGKTFVWNGRKYPPGLYYLVRRGGRKALVSKKATKSVCGGAMEERVGGGAVELTKEEVALLKKIRDNWSRVHESLLSEKEREIARRLAPTPYIWYYNGWIQLTKDGSNAIDEYERKENESVIKAVRDVLWVEKMVLRDYIKKKGKLPLKGLVVLHGDKFITDMIREGLIGVMFEDGELYAFVEEEDEEDYDEDDQEFIDEREMYYTVKVRGMMRLDELLEMFRGIGGDKLFKSLKEKGLLTVETVDGIEYVKAK